MMSLMLSPNNHDVCEGCIKLSQEGVNLSVIHYLQSKVISEKTHSSEIINESDISKHLSEILCGENTKQGSIDNNQKSNFEFLKGIIYMQLFLKFNV